MKKIAFDVQGTLLGRRSTNILRFFVEAQRRGHELTVWSVGGVSMATDACLELGIQARCMAKRYRYEEDHGYFDIAVDDDKLQARFLSAGRVIMVDEVPEETDQIYAAMDLWGL